MRTCDVKFGSNYLLDGKEVVTIVEKVSGRDTKRRMMQSGELYQKTKKKFRLSNGEVVFANRLEKI